MTAHVADKSFQPSQPPPPPLPPNQKNKQKTLKAGKRISLFFSSLDKGQNWKKPNRMMLKIMQAPQDVLLTKDIDEAIFNLKCSLNDLILPYRKTQN